LEGSKLKKREEEEEEEKEAQVREPMSEREKE